MDLYPYQREGVEWLGQAKNRLLADEMGLGKTVQCIIASELLGCRRILVLCPALVRAVWEAEFERFADRTDVDLIRSGKDRPTQNIVVCSYDLAVRKAMLEQLTRQWDMLILDEAHFLKERTAKRTKVAYKTLAPLADRVIAVTGTPMPNHPGELWPAMSTLFPESLAGIKDYWTFMRRYTKGFEGEWGWTVTGGRNLQQLRERLAPHILRRRKADVELQLPPIAWNYRVVEPGEVDLDLDFNVYQYGPPEHFRKTLQTDVSVVKGVMLRQDVSAKSEMLNAMKSQMSTLRKYCGLQKVDPCVEFVNSLIREGEQKVVVFCWHQRVVESLRQKLAHHGARSLFGGSNEKAKEKALQAFRAPHYNPKACNVLVCNIASAGTGITLTNARTVVFCEMDWTPANNAQAAMRVHRIGQEHPVQIYMLCVRDSIDKRIVETLGRKAEMMAELLD